jgi:uncharacterized SAM-binding protein YcdF (DUF218 family)
MKGLTNFLLGIGIFVAYLIGCFFVIAHRAAAANPNPSGEVGWDVVSLLHNSSRWGLGVLFLISFLLAYAIVRFLSKRVSDEGPDQRG